MGIDPESGEPVPFDLADRRFALTYFDLLLHPEEDRGVDFWWIDWQQGDLSRMPGLDPLYWLNHLHFYDLARPAQDPSNKPKRPFIFSRWGGLGNHRYPIGFSGDTIITWASLAFQPYFTSTAANVGYGWWSHDIGGHFGGISDPELYTRWVQYGLLSPILRLHSTKNAQLERRPFGYDTEVLRITRVALQHRHSLIPYLYTLSWRDHKESEAPIRPMYHDYPEADAAYCSPDQYLFGPDLIAAPHIHPKDSETGLTRQVVWLPEGGWHFFSGEYLSAGHHARYAHMEDIPLFAKPGAIVPWANWEDWQAPERLTLHVFPGASNLFELYEDDGETEAYRLGAKRLTPFKLDWEEGVAEFQIGPARGHPEINPETRIFDLLFRGIQAPEGISASINDRRIEPGVYDPSTSTFKIVDIRLNPEDRFQIRFQAAVANDERIPEKLEMMVQAFRMDNTSKQVLIDSIPGILTDPELLAAFRPALSEGQMRALLEVLIKAGIEHITHTQEEVFFLWNNTEDRRITSQVSTERYRSWLAKDRFQLEAGIVPKFLDYRVRQDLTDTNWTAMLHYGTSLSVEIPERRRGRRGLGLDDLGS